MPQLSLSLGRAVLLSLGFVLFGIGTRARKPPNPKRSCCCTRTDGRRRHSDAFVHSFRTEMLRTWPEKAAFYDFSLETGRPDIGENEGAIVQVLRVPLRRHEAGSRRGGRCAGCALLYPASRRIVPAVPILVIADERTVPVEALKRGDSIVGIKTSGPQAVNGILELLPETTTIAVIFGSSPGEQFWAAELRKEFAPFEDRVKFVWLDNLPLSEVRERVAALRPGAVALYGRVSGGCSRHTI